MLGVFPFGEPLRPVVQRDRGPKDVFVLGDKAKAPRYAAPPEGQRVAWGTDPRD